MNPGQKPEWIELADSDKAIKHRQISKGLPILAIAITAAIIAAGTIFAQPQQLSVASADSIITTSQNSDQVAPEAPAVADTQPVQLNTEPAKVPSVNSENPADIPTVDSTLPTTNKNPTIATMPTKSADDEGNGD